MWNEDYEALNSYEKGEFRRIGNYLLSHSYLVKYTYKASDGVIVANADYRFVGRLFALFQSYFDVTGWLLEKDDNYGYMSLMNIYDHNRYRMDQFTTLFLYTCRLYYEEMRDQAGSFHTIPTSTSQIIQKMAVLRLLKNGKATQKERLDAQRTLAHFNIIEKIDQSSWNAEGNNFIILPSILAIISNKGINDMVDELSELSDAVAEDKISEVDDQ